MNTHRNIGNATNGYYHNSGPPTALLSYCASGQPTASPACCKRQRSANRVAFLLRQRPTNRFANLLHAPAVRQPLQELEKVVVEVTPHLVPCDATLANNLCFGRMPLIVDPRSVSSFLLQRIYDARRHVAAF